MFLLAAIAIPLLSAVAAVLFVPVSVEIEATKTADDDAVKTRVEIRWFGLRLNRPRPATAPARTPKSGKSRRPTGPRELVALLRSPGFLPRCRRLVLDTIRMVRPETLQIDARVGFDDPADTGALLAWTYGSRLGRIARITPDFSGEILEGRLFVKWRRSAARALWPTLAFSLSPVVWRAFRRQRAMRRS